MTKDNMKITLCTLILATFTIPCLAQFVDVAPTSGVSINGAKDGGTSFVDFNNDGCLDLIVNTSDATNRTRLYQNNCDYPNPTFTDVTASLAPQFLNNTLDRSAIWGDFNNDGYVDFARNVSWKIEVYQNQGPMGSPAWSFGQADHSPNYSTSSLNGGFNTEGLAWVDYNGDGFLDIIVENHNYGIDILRNPADCSANFFHITPNSSPLGLPTWASDGDYMSTSDYNDDGWVDILARKKNQNDLWRNDGGTYSNIQNIDQATNANKGSVLLADFDMDGDFDLFWTSNGVNQIWEQTGVNSGNYVATGEPAASSGITIGNDVNACAAQDIDNDGDTDLVLVNNSGTGKVFINNSSGTAWNFTQNNNGININGNGEGIVFGDYDNDGDQDLYVNKTFGNNQLWENRTDDNNYLIVDPRLWLGGTFSRSDHGATAILYNADGTQIKGGIKDTRSSFGHGCQQGELIHFGLPDGPNVEYRLVLKFTNIGGERVTETVNITPADLPDQKFTFTRNTFGNLGFLGCNALPIELEKFSAEAKKYRVQLDWTTASEKNNDHFLVLRSSDAQNFTPIARVPGAGDSNLPLNYQELDTDPLTNWSYYQLQQIDYNGGTSFSDIEAVLFEPDAIKINVYPNPINRDQTEWKLWLLGFDEEQAVQVYLVGLQGQIIYEKNLIMFGNSLTHSIEKPSHLASGVYFLKIAWEGGSLNRNVLVN